MLSSLGLVGTLAPLSPWLSLVICRPNTRVSSAISGMRDGSFLSGLHHAMPSVHKHGVPLGLLIRLRYGRVGYAQPAVGYLGTCFVTLAFLFSSDITIFSCRWVYSRKDARCCVDDTSLPGKSYAPLKVNILIAFLSKTSAPSSQELLFISRISEDCGLEQDMIRAMKLGAPASERTSILLDVDGRKAPSTSLALARISLSSCCFS